MRGLLVGCSLVFLGCGAPARPAPASGGAAAPAPGALASAAPGQPAQGQAPQPRAGAPDEGCDEAFPQRLWPVMAESAACADGAGNARSTTGPGSANWFHFGGCGGHAVLEAAAGQEVRIKASGDGCGCEGCVLWHVNYDIEEIGTLGFYETKAHIEEPDERCPGGKETVNFKTFQPVHGRFRLNATSGQGFYFTACGR